MCYYRFNKGEFIAGVDRVTSITTREDLVRFLVDMKKILARENSLLLVERQKNLQFLASLGYTINDAKMVLLNLSVKDYSAGPESDHNPSFPGYIWLFGYRVDGEELYIKIKLITGQFQRVVCISFHEAKWALLYPFKE